MSKPFVDLLPWECVSLCCQNIAWVFLAFRSARHRNHNVGLAQEYLFILAMEDGEFFAKPVIKQLLCISFHYELSSFIKCWTFVIKELKATCVMCCRFWSVRRILGSITVLTHLSTEIHWAFMPGIIHPGPAALRCVQEVTVFCLLWLNCLFTYTHKEIIHTWKWHLKVLLKETEFKWCTHSQWLLNARENQAVQHSSHKQCTFPMSAC